MTPEGRFQRDGSHLVTYLPPKTSRTIRLASPEVGEAEFEAVRRVLMSGVLTNGPETEAFEQEFASRHGVAHGVAVANGTLALTAVWTALGLGPADEVIVPSFTFISSATSILHAGATPVLADVQPDTFNLDPADVARRITSRTRAILAVHYGGQPADMQELASIADDSGVALVEDAAEAHGATYQGRPAGSLGRTAIFSFTATKNITTGEGGLVTTDDSELADRIRLLRNHGQTSPYRHDILGFNWRMTEMQAAMGRAQLDRLDEILQRKQRLAAALTEELERIPGIEPPVTRRDRTHVFMLYTTLVEARRDRLLACLNEAGIEAKIYFPPVHRQPMFSECVKGGLPVTEWLTERVLSLPLPSQLPLSDVGLIADAVRIAVEKAA